MMVSLFTGLKAGASTAKSRVKNPGGNDFGRDDNSI
jgi:hypothetical protein